jgi:hypothetical protein
MFAALGAGSLAKEPQPSMQRFNYILGTQTIGPAYQFTDKHVLVETAEVIAGMGANVIKFELSKGYPKKAGVRSDIHSLKELARDEPAHRAVLDMPFANIILWMNTFQDNDWKRGLTAEAAEREYMEVYDFVCHLLQTYSHTGKSFYLGHWEGDGLLRGSVARENDALVTSQKVQGMIAWLNVRQKAVDDAKRDTPHEGVEVWHYTEVNHVVLAMEEGRPALVNEVLPHVPVDFVSYSAYDTTNQAHPERIKTALAYIETKLSPKPWIQGKRVFIGEYGFQALVGETRTPRTPGRSNQLALVVMKTGIDWGCPFVLYWELYNNEVAPDGSQIGFWMINDKGEKTPVYDSHARYYAWARKFVADHVDKHGIAPGDALFRKAAVSFLNAITPLDDAP